MMSLGAKLVNETTAPGFLKRNRPSDIWMNLINCLLDLVSPLFLLQRVPCGIPLPPELKPPTRPQVRPKAVAPPRGKNQKHLILLAVFYLFFGSSGETEVSTICLLSLV